MESTCIILINQKFECDISPFLYLYRYLSFLFVPLRFFSFHLGFFRFSYGISFLVDCVMGEEFVGRNLMRVIVGALALASASASVWFGLVLVELCFKA